MIDVVYDNILLVNGRFLGPEAPPHDLRRILIAANTTIRMAIDATYKKYRSTAPQVQRASVWVMRLAYNPGVVIRLEHIQRNAMAQSNRGIFSDMDAITPHYAPYFEAVIDAQLLPEVRINQRPANTKASAAYLLVRDTPLE